MAIDADSRGVFAIAPTPFHPDGAVDSASLRRLIDFYASAGVTGLTVLGQMGEAPKLAAEESLAIVRTVLERTALPVVVGVTAPGFGTMRTLAHEVMTMGAAGVMVAPPNTLRTDDQIIAYYTQAAEALGPDVPICLQDYPLSFSVQISPRVISQIVETVPSIVMLKHEDWPGLEKITAIREREAAGQRRLSILCGNGGLFLDFELERGADGAMTGYCFPELLVDMVRLTSSGRRDEAHDLFDAHLPLIRYEQQPGTGLAVRKYVMQRRGILDSAAQRRPGRELSKWERDEVDFLLGRLARRDTRARVPNP
ncbi:dihydrodipicolinate synthase family protein [Agromyces kandeliae]|uniref:Dihydrodipicolinate synthase family protein n=1 Tax=Agromyces kandeliae TaxID=2666141 RepID=A0A6L5R6R2_9MICO|nr:dihydrodipicolinate synthase family protein [Agromyces kandeliae]MRX45224.1 dihydrodipicolinate synthase family protein [Agromyces kandeliae]